MKSGGRNGANKATVGSCAWLRSRELGSCRPGPSCSTAHWYGRIEPYSIFDPSTQMRKGVFGLGFSPDGRVLGAVSENRSISFFDPLCPPEPWLCLASAHRDCVNCIKFLDNRLFATCSDDQAVKLWDLRSMKSEVRTLHGHTSWVKNVEFAAEKGLLITSGFDHNIFAWDINAMDCIPKKMVGAEGLMRMRLTPGADKMLVSTQYGYLLVIHDLDLDTLSDDMRGFKPNTFWISIETQSLFPPGKEHLKRFTADRNRTELIVDFPTGCDPDHISCVAPHPYGWAVASRMNNIDDRSEWTTVHDVQLPPVDPTALFENKLDDGEERLEKSDDETAPDHSLMEVDLDGSSARQRPQLQPDSGRRQRATVIRLRTERRAETLGTSSVWAETDSSSSDEEDAIPAEYRPFRGSGVDAAADAFRPTMVSSFLPRSLPRFPAWRQAAFRNRTGTAARSREGARASPSDARSAQPATSSANEPPADAEAESTSAGPSTAAAGDALANRPPRVRIINSFNPQRPGRTVVIFGGGTSPRYGSTERRHNTLDKGALAAPKTYRRLLYHTDEPRQGRGFIKELCWSPDGRVIASPYAFGCRLLAFTDKCDEISDAHWKRSPPAKQLVEIRSLVGCLGHTDVVLCSQFSPVHEALLVTGCLQGKVSFCQPKL